MNCWGALCGPLLHKHPAFWLALIATIYFTTANSFIAFGRWPFDVKNKATAGPFSNLNMTNGRQSSMIGLWHLLLIRAINFLTCYFWTMAEPLSFIPKFFLFPTMKTFEFIVLVWDLCFGSSNVIVLYFCSFPRLFRLRRGNTYLIWHALAYGCLRLNVVTKSKLLTPPP